jgi:hypothetical protein
MHNVRSCSYSQTWTRHLCVLEGELDGVNCQMPYQHVPTCPDTTALCPLREVLLICPDANK